jgi:hypothetical protein
VSTEDQIDPREQKALEDIRTHGCHVIHVLEEGSLPPFSYSVGIQQTSKVPEVMVVGLNRELAHFIVNEYNRRVRLGDEFFSGHADSGFLEGFDVRFERVAKAHYPTYLGWDLWLYGGAGFEAVQVIYPTTDGIWPWDSAAPSWFKEQQPLLLDADPPAG